jgi:replication-associated recombination protein RarA
MSDSRPVTKGGYDLFEVASAFQKSIRRGIEDAALFWATELDISGYGKYAWKRMRIMASEDIGIAETTLPAQIRALYENWKEQNEMKDVKHRPERLFFVHAVLLLARAKKSRIVDNALIAFYGSNRPKPAIPDYAYDKHTVVGRKKGRGWEHFFTEGVKLENQAPIEDRYFERAKKVAMAGMVDNFGDAIDHDENLNVPVRGTQKRMF